MICISNSFFFLRFLIKLTQHFSRNTYINTVHTRSIHISALCNSATVNQHKDMGLTAVNPFSLLNFHLLSSFILPYPQICLISLWKVTTNAVFKLKLHLFLQVTFSTGMWQSAYQRASFLINILRPKVKYGGGHMSPSVLFL